MTLFSKAKVFLQESRREFGRVNWPTRQETTKHTLVVIGISLAIAAFLGGLDYVFTTLLTKFVL